MNLSYFHRTALSAALMLVLALSPAVSEAAETASNDSPKLMSAGALSVPALATLNEDKLYQKGMKVSKEIDGKRFYSDGRLAKERVGDVVSVHTYQDDVNGHTVYKLDKKNRTYLVEQYFNNVLQSTLSSDGTYSVHLINETTNQITQKIVTKGPEVYVYDYTYGSLVVTEPDGEQHTESALVEISESLSLATGTVLFSTTYLSTDETNAKIENKVFHMTGEETTTKDGLLVESKDADGHVTTYTYQKNKKGEMMKRVATRDDGVVTITKIRNQKPPHVDFGKVLRAALQSVRRPGEVFKAATKDGNVYSFKNGQLMNVEYKPADVKYNFLKGATLASVEKGGVTVVKEQDGMYIKI